MPVEEQLLNNSYGVLRAGQDLRGGQILTIASRKVTKLAFLIYKTGLPTGEITYEIRKVSDDSLINSKILGDAGDLSETPAWLEVTFVIAETIDEEVRILAHFEDGSSGNAVLYRVQNTDVKGGENWSYGDIGDWTGQATYDCAYIYTYEEAAAGLENKSANMAAKLVAAGVM